MIKNRNTPIWIMAFTAFSILGAFFPVYGIYVGSSKLTLFRLGVFPLLLTQAGSLFKYNKKLLYIIIVFFIMRLFSLAWSDDIDNGIKQLFWFFEGSCLMFSANAALNRYSDYGKVFLNLTIAIGAVSISYILLQTIFYFGMGYKLFVPFTQNLPELAEGGQYWNYPIYGTGRIIGAFYDPNMAGSMCCYYFALLFPFATQKNKYIKWLVIPLLLILIASIFTGSRQSAVGIILCVIVYFLYFSKNRSKSFLYFVIIIAAISIFASQYFDSYSILFEDSENVFSRFERNSGGDTATDISGGRFSYMEKVWKEYGFSNFFFGVGEGVTHGGGHNVFIAVFLENGIFTLLVFLWMLGRFVNSSFKSYIHYPLPINNSSCLIIISWIFLMLVNWAQLNQSLSFVYLCFVFLSSSKIMRQRANGFI